MSCRHLLAAVGVGVTLLACPGPAGAAFEPMALISVTPTEQGLAGSGPPVISADGRFVAFQDASRNFETGPAPAGAFRRGGLYRARVGSAGLELVAGGDVVDTNSGKDRLFGATSPAISADGRFVAFQTDEPLVASDGNTVSDVYVRDMSRTIDDPLAFELASAVDGGAAPPVYDGSRGRSQVPFAGGGYLSADGRSVAFKVVGASSLTPGAPAAATPDQAFVRRLDQGRTELVSVRRDAATGLATGVPAGGVETPPRLSADGTTVIWRGAGASTQARVVRGEGNDDSAPELLWRRLADGPTTATRRVAPIGDPDDPGLRADGAVTTSNLPAQGPCDGFFAVPTGGVTGEALSGDGRIVAFVSSGYPRTTPVEVRAGDGPGRADLFSADMSPGVSRKGGTVELTRESSDRDDPTISADVVGVAISTDGRRVALFTQRTRFLLSSPNLTGAPAARSGGAELYLLDRPSSTIELVTRAYDGGKAVNDTVPPTPSLDGNGTRLAFQSTADSLVRGDANGQPDAFLATRRIETVVPGVQTPSPPPRPLTFVPTRLLRVTATPRRDGTLRVVAVAPAKGTLSLTARTTGRKPSRILRRTAKAAGGRSVLVLRPGTAWRRRSRSTAGLPADLSVSFSQKGFKALSRKLRVRFVIRPAPKKATPTTTKKSR